MCPTGGGGGTKTASRKVTHTLGPKIFLESPTIRRSLNSRFYINRWYSLTGPTELCSLLQDVRKKMQLHKSVMDMSYCPCNKILLRATAEKVSLCAGRKYGHFGRTVHRNTYNIRANQNTSIHPNELQRIQVLRHQVGGQQTVFGVVTRLPAERFGVRNPVKIFIFSKTTRPLLGPTHCPIQCVAVCLHGGVQAAEACSWTTPSGAEFKNEWSFRKWDVEGGGGMDWIALAQDKQFESSCERGNESSCSVKCGEFD